MDTVNVMVGVAGGIDPLRILQEPLPGELLINPKHVAGGLDPLRILQGAYARRTDEQPRVAGGLDPLRILQVYV